MFAALLVQKKYMLQPVLAVLRIFGRNQPVYYYSVCDLHRQKLKKNISDSCPPMTKIGVFRMTFFIGQNNDLVV